MRKLVVGNWKMQGSLQSHQCLMQALLEGLPAQVGVEVVVCPPFPYIQAVVQHIRANQKATLGVGAQDVSQHANGAFTGQVSATMLIDLGCRFVIVGHSERRQYCGEGDAVVAQKALAAIQVGLTPVICVGESLKERQAGRTEAVIQVQLEALLQVDPHLCQKAVLAYEPIWAIGTGISAKATEAEAVHAKIRAVVAKKDPVGAQQVPILYGGSMKPENAVELLSMPNVNGGLVGGASLVAADFLSIIRGACVSL